MMISEKIDIYSFGVVLFEAICGKPPMLKVMGSEDSNIHIIDWVKSILSQSNNGMSFEIKMI